MESSFLLRARVNRSHLKTAEKIFRTLGLVLKPVLAKSGSRIWGWPPKAARFSSSQFRMRTMPDLWSWSRP